MLKRQMFGQARLDLLSRRFVRRHFVRIPGRGHAGGQGGQESLEPHTGAAAASPRVLA